MVPTRERAKHESSYLLVKRLSQHHMLSLSDQCTYTFRRSYFLFFSLNQEPVVFLIAGPKKEQDEAVSRSCRSSWRDARDLAEATQASPL